MCTFTVLHSSLSSALAVSHKCWHIVFSLSFSSKHFLFLWWSLCELRVLRKMVLKFQICGNIPGTFCYWFVMWFFYRQVIHSEMNSVLLNLLYLLKWPRMSFVLITFQRYYCNGCIFLCTLVIYTIIITSKVYRRHTHTYTYSANECIHVYAHTKTYILACTVI